MIEVGSAAATVHIGDRVLITCSSARGHTRTLLHRCRLVAETVGQASHASSSTAGLDPSPAPRRRTMTRGPGRGLPEQPGNSPGGAALASPRRRRPVRALERQGLRGRCRALRAAAEGSAAWSAKDRSHVGPRRAGDRGHVELQLPHRLAARPLRARHGRRPPTAPRTRPRLAGRADRRRPTTRSPRPPPVRRHRGVTGAARSTCSASTPRHALLTATVGRVEDIAPDVNASADPEEPA